MIALRRRVRFGYWGRGEVREWIGRDTPKLRRRIEVCKMVMRLSGNPDLWLETSWVSSDNDTRGDIVKDDWLGMTLRVKNAVAWHEMSLLEWASEFPSQSTRSI